MYRIMIKKYAKLYLVIFFCINVKNTKKNKI